MIDSETLRRIQANAQLVIETFTPLAGFTLGFNEESVRYVERYILSIRQTAKADVIHSLTNIIGCYVGECIRHNFGGYWESSDNGLGISFDAKSSVYPANKVGKLFEHGPEDSVVSFYTLIPVVFASVLQGPTGPAA